jgi:hypothetical protein
MKRIELWRWRYDPVRRKHLTTGFVLSEADAALQYPDGCEKVEGSLEVRGEVPETDAERAAGSTSAWRRSGPDGDHHAADR